MTPPKCLRKISSRLSRVGSPSRYSSAAISITAWEIRLRIYSARFATPFLATLDKISLKSASLKERWKYITRYKCKFKLKHLFCNRIWKLSFQIQPPIAREISDMAILLCSPLSLSLKVTESFSRVSKSIVTQNGVPISSCLL